MEERDGAKNVIQGYQLRVESRQKKTQEARDRCGKLQREETALADRIKLLTEMERMHEGYSKAVKLVMG